MEVQSVNRTARLEQVTGKCRQQAIIVAITSGKGGVGKTNIAANLAVCLAAWRQKVVLFDADLSLANLDVVMGLNSRYNIGHVLRGQKSIDEIIHTGPGGLSVVCGGSGLEQLADLNEFQRQRLLAELAKLQGSSEIIIVDTAAGISKSVIAFCLASDHTLVVTTPQATAMTDAYATTKVLSKNHYPGHISVVVNMAESISQGRETYRHMASVAKRFLDRHLYDAGVILRDEQLNHAVRMRKPVVLAYPKANVSKSLASLARKLSSDLPAESDGKGFFRKVVDFFL